MRKRLKSHKPRTGGDDPTRRAFIDELRKRFSRQKVVQLSRKPAAAITLAALFIVRRGVTQ